MKMVEFQPSWDSLKWAWVVFFKMSFFLERQKYVKEKTTALFQSLLGASYIQKRSKFEFSSPSQEI